MRLRRTWKSDVFNVKDFGPDPGKALLAALKKAEANGGGIVYLPRGRYPVQDRLVVPNNTVLKGESMELVSLYWPDFDKPPTDLLHGRELRPRFAEPVLPELQERGGRARTSRTACSSVTCGFGRTATS